MARAGGDRRQNSIRLSIGPSLCFGIGERKQGAEKEPLVLAEILGAILRVRAMYLESGFGDARDAVIQWYKSGDTRTSPG